MREKSPRRQSRERGRDKSSNCYAKERAVIYERDRGRPRDTRRRPPQSGAHATWDQNQRRRVEKGDTLQLRDLTRGRKEGDGDRPRSECERRRPRLLASYKNCLSCPPSCLLTHSDPKEKEGKEGAHSEGRRKALCSAVVFVVSLHAASDATTLCRRRQQHNGGGGEGRDTKRSG